MYTRLASLMLAAGLVLLAAPTASAQTDPDGTMHCPLPTSKECIDAWLDMVSSEDGLLAWACGFVNGEESCGPYGYDIDYVCHTITGHPCHDDQGDD